MSFSVFFYVSALLKRIYTDTSVVPRLHYTGTRGRPERVFRSVMKTLIKLIQKLLVSNKFYSGIMW